MNVALLVPLSVVGYLVIGLTTMVVFSALFYMEEDGDIWVVGPVLTLLFWPVAWLTVGVWQSFKGGGKLSMRIIKRLNPQVKGWC